MRESRRVSGKEQPRTEARMKGSEGEVSWLRQRGGISTHWERERGARREIHQKSVSISTVRRHMKEPVFRRNFGLLISICLCLSVFPHFPSTPLFRYLFIPFSSFPPLLSVLFPLSLFHYTIFPDTFSIPHSLVPLSMPSHHHLPRTSTKRDYSISYSSGRTIRVRKET